MENTEIKTPGTGALLDERSVEDRDKDYQFSEIVAAADPVVWVEKPEDKWRKFPIFAQDGSGSCVAQTAAKLLGIMYWLKNGLYVHFSATDVYQRRINKPASGMGGDDVFRVMRQGVTLEELVPSQDMSDEAMDGVVIPEYKRKVGEVFKLGNYVAMPAGDIETIASVIQKTGKGVMVWFFWKFEEWTAEPVVMFANLTKEVANRHSVTAVDFFLKDGKKCLLIEDSWGQQYGYSGRRIITEDFFKKRNWYAAYPIDFVFEQVVVRKPVHIFSKTLTLSAVKDLDVVALQDILRYEGLFPANVQSTGVYGAITAKAVYAWQVKHQVASLVELDTLKGKTVGPKSISVLNELYGA